MKSTLQKEAPFTSIIFVSNGDECRVWFDAMELCMHLWAFGFNFLWLLEEEICDHFEIMDDDQDKSGVYVDFVGLLLMLDRVERRDASLLGKQDFHAKKMEIIQWVADEALPIVPHIQAWLASGRGQGVCRCSCRCGCIRY